MASTGPRYSKEEIARRGDEIYDNDIRPLLKPEDDGKLVAIDIETGEYKVDTDEMAVVHRLRARIPGAQPWVLRVGSRYVRRFGGRGLRWKS